MHSVSFFSTNSTVIIMGICVVVNKAEMRSKMVLFPLWDDMGQKVCVITWGEWAIAMHSRYESPILFILCTYTLTDL